MDTGGGHDTREANASGRDALTPKVRPNAAQRSVTEQGRPALERWIPAAHMPALLDRRPVFRRKIDLSGIPGSPPHSLRE
ncbi:MAG: hypothetical protein ACLFS4_06060 [Opitutales bacterium]